jgi:hypothetical protein
MSKPTPTVYRVKWKRARLMNVKHKDFYDRGEADADFAARQSMLNPGSTISMIERKLSPTTGQIVELMLHIQTVKRRPSGRARRASEVRL